MNSSKEKNRFDMVRANPIIMFSSVSNKIELYFKLCRYVVQARLEGTL